MELKMVELVAVREKKVLIGKRSNLRTRLFFILSAKFLKYTWLDTTLKESQFQVLNLKRSRELFLLF